VLAEAGAHVLAADLNGEAAADIAESIRCAGLSADPFQVDVTDPGSMKEMVEAALRFSGSLDILINSAAIDPKFDLQHGQVFGNTFEDYPLDEWNRALTVNLTGVFLSCQAAARPMLAQGKGSIINICSTYGLAGPDQRIYQQSEKPSQYKPAYYSTTKAGILGFTRYLAAYYAGKNIRVNALTPGGVFNGHDEEFVKAYSARTILGRMADLKEMNGAVLFLSSDASSYMTGSNLIVDGGWTAW
jgi:2-deoxy-D-gluconate 3-dehydrogenase